MVNKEYTEFLKVYTRVPRHSLEQELARFTGQGWLAARPSQASGEGTNIYLKRRWQGDEAYYQLKLDRSVQLVVRWPYHELFQAYAKLSGVHLASLDRFVDGLGPFLSFDFQSSLTESEARGLLNEWLKYRYAQSEAVRAEGT